MTDKTVFREVYNYFVRYAEGASSGGEAYWLAALQSLGETYARLGSTDFARDLLTAVFLELERRGG